MAESQKETATRLAAERERKKARKLPALWKTFIWVSLGALVGSKLLYSLAWFKVRTLDSCVPNPSDLDVFLTEDLPTVAALLLTALLITGLHHLENKE